MFIEHNKRQFELRESNITSTLISTQENGESFYLEVNIIHMIIYGYLRSWDGDDLSINSLKYFLVRGSSYLNEHRMWRSHVKISFTSSEEGDNLSLLLIYL